MENAVHLPASPKNDFWKGLFISILTACKFYKATVSVVYVVISHKPTQVEINYLLVHSKKSFISYDLLWDHRTRSGFFSLSAILRLITPTLSKSQTQNWKSNNKTDNKDSHLMSCDNTCRSCDHLSSAGVWRQNQAGRCRTQHQWDESLGGQASTYVH